MRFIALVVIFAIYQFALLTMNNKISFEVAVITALALILAHVTLDRE